MTENPLVATSRYESVWEGFWRDLPQTPGAALWDGDPHVTAAVHLPLFESHFDPALPLLDLGCGNGTQTRFLAGRYARVLGVDVSASALARARTTNGAPNIDYRRMNLLDPTQTAALRQGVGDVNVYLRAVVDQLDPEDWPAAVSALALLAGQRGHVFMMELAPAGRRLLHELVVRAGAPPAKLIRVLRHGITPGQLDHGDLQPLLDKAGFAVLASGETSAFYTQSLPDGSPLELPMRYALMRHGPGL
ncbi:MAG: class I SAM-dependent methyltransferase [Egibacteraceae bacterium]